MTTIVEKPCAEWIPVAWDEPAKACEMVHYHPRLGERRVGATQARKGYPVFAGR